FQPYRPLHSVVEIGGAVVVRNHAGAVGIAVQDRPLFRPCLVARLELPQNVERHRYGLAEHDLPDIDGDALCGVHGLGKTWRRGREAALALLAITIKLQMSEME